MITANARTAAKGAVLELRELFARFNEETAP
jgi:hypothetical protein